MKLIPFKILTEKNKFSLKNIVVSIFALSVLVSCGGKQNNNNSLTNTDAVQEEENSAVNVNEQAKPNLIVIPSDELLQKFEMLKEENAQGKTIYVRDYKGYLLKDPNAKFIISTIQSTFINVGFPLNDLEQTLKSLNDQEIMDDVDNIQKDAKTMLLTSVRPDIILELNYDLVTDNSSRSLNKTLTYTLRGIDAFSNKVVSTIQETGYGKNNPDNDAGSLMKQALDLNLKNYVNQLNLYFSDIVKKGREITLRVAIDKGVSLSMEDDCLDGDTYADWVVDYLKVNTQKGAYKMERNTETEIFFRNVRIKTLNDDGTQYSAYDFAKDMRKAMVKGCGIKSKNKTQGLSNAFIVLKGM
jgi:hypothetical protein